MAQPVRILRWQFSLREALLLGFCATFIVLTRAALRLHFSLPGHTMFLMMFFLILARGCVPKLGAATLVGVVSGMVCLLLGMTKAPPLIVTNFVLPGVVVDVAAAVYPRVATSYVASVLAAVVASVSKGLSAAGLDYLMRVDEELVFQHVLITTLAGIAFGALGAALVPPVIRRLQANKLIPTS
jgi:ABC-type thiamin/hydroxymethylpyrimidine transport system permease subunit